MIRLAGVFLRNTPPKRIPALTPRTNVAGLMISSDKALRGVAPAARFILRLVRSKPAVNQKVSAQHVALQNGRDVARINFSFGETSSATRDQMHFRWQRLANAVY